MRVLVIFIVYMLAWMPGFAQENVKSAKAGEQYGATFEIDNVISVDTLDNLLQTHDNFSGQIQGIVTAVCVKKGCFIKLKRVNSEEPVMVRFLDYGFFMPRNIVGKLVVLNGTASVKQTSIAQLKHYAEDAGKDSSETAKITAPKNDIEIIASGVKVIQ